MRTLVVASATSAAVLATACNGLNLYTSLLYLLSFTIWLLTGGHYFLYLAYHTLGRDIGAAWFFIRLMTLSKWAEYVNWNVPKMFIRTAKRIPDQIMFYFEDQTWTFREVDEYSNKVANLFLSAGFSKGDTVALYMENRPEYVASWLGLAKIGVVPALVNHNQKKQAFLHAVNVAKAKAVLFGAEFTKDVIELMSLSSETEFRLFGSGLKYTPEHRDAFKNQLPSQTVDLDEALTNSSSDPMSQSILDSINFKDTLLFIYTSGTTGLPKAAVIKHSRFILASGGCRFVIGVRSSDVFYSPFPLHHSVAGMIAIAGCFAAGFKFVLRKKFSASQYWKDCQKYKVTVGQYIGEICRYLLNTPHCPEEKTHTIRLMFGNGLRPQIWPQFIKRFNIPNIAEFYGSTEGNSNIINKDNVIGSVGFVPVLFPGVLPLGLIKVNKENGEPVRDSNGLCIRCQPGEPGEFVGEIVRNHPARDFHGYADKTATAKKILNDVWRKGDTCFRSGDMLVMDKFGYLYFKDRVGDTFRWRGENVSTAEVEATISNMIHLRDAAVYGVQIPGTEGRAGMAAIHDPNGDLDLTELAKGIKEQLPSFARPLFIRLVKHLDLTGTFKLKKFNLQREGFDVSEIDKSGSTDKLFFLHPKTGKYEALTTDLLNSIVNGLIRL